MTTTGVPAMQAWRTTVRASDCDYFGPTNNAVYTDFAISATLAQWSETFRADEWRLRSIQMDFKSPSNYGDQIEVTSWPAGQDDGYLRCGYRILNRNDQSVVAEAAATWEVPAEVSIERWPVHAEAREQKLRSSPQNPNRPEAFTYRRVVVVQPYEADQTGYVNPTWFFRWGWASAIFAAEQAGWPWERWKSVGALTFQIHRDAELNGTLQPGDRVEIHSKLYDVQRIQATWEHRVIRGDSIIAIDRASGALLNSEGRIHPAPSGMMESIVAGRAIQ